MNTEISARVTLWTNRAIMVILGVLAVTLPWVLEFTDSLRPMGEASRRAILIAFYCCLGLVAYALYSIDKLMGNILGGRVFVTENVVRLRWLRWCCAGVSVICLPASFFYPPLFLMVLIMAFLALVVSVLKSVMAAAVELREENDLTV